MFYIVTDREKEIEIKKFILEELHHGATIFKVKGGEIKWQETVYLEKKP